MAKLVVRGLDVILSANRNTILYLSDDLSNIRWKILIDDEHPVKYILNLFTGTATSTASTDMPSVLEKKPYKVPTLTVDQLKTSGSHMDFMNVNVCIFLKAKFLVINSKKRNLVFLEQKS